MIRSSNAMPLLGATDDPEAMEVRGSDSGGVPMATTLQVVVVVKETSQKASDTFEYEINCSEATEESTEKMALAVDYEINNSEAMEESTEKMALVVAAIAAVDLTNLFFLLRGDTEWRRWEWTGGIPVLFAFAALLSAAGFVLGVSAARSRVILVASAATLFMALAGTVLALLG